MGKPCSLIPLSVFEMYGTLSATLLCAWLLQAGAMRTAIKEREAVEEQESVGDVCSTAVTGSGKRLTFGKQDKKCKCKSDMLVMGDNAACQTASRYFDPINMTGLGCACTKCSEIVTNSKLRKSANKHDNLKCKCPKGQTTSGKDKRCFSPDYGRY